MCFYSELTIISLFTHFLIVYTFFDISGPQTLTYNTNLRSLCIYFPTVMDRTRSLLVVAEMLSQISSRRLHRLILNLQSLRWIDVYDYLTLGLKDENERKHTAWKAVDASLAEDKFQSLELVEIIGSLPSNSDIPPQDFRSQMTSRLPGVMARGITKVHLYFRVT